MIRTFFCALFAVGLFAGPAAAHRIGVPVTTIEWNVSSAVWEVTHRISAHDFDKVMAGKISPSALYETVEGLALIKAYADDAFELKGQGADLTFIGAELDHDMVWVYYELNVDAPLISIDSNLLIDQSKTSHALVNVGSAKGIQTLSFTAADGPMQIELVSPAAP